MCPNYAEPYSIMVVFSVVYSKNGKSSRPLFALRNSIRLPTIKVVGIANINAFPLDTFDHCKNLRDLQLYVRI